MALGNDAEERGRLAEAEVSYNRKLIALSFWVRTVSLAAAAFCAYFLEKVMTFRLPSPVFYVLSAWLTTSLVYLMLFRFSGICRAKNKLDYLHFSYYFFSVIWTTLLVHYLGAVEWVGILFYVFDIVYANVLMSRGKGTSVALFAVAAYFALVLLEQRGIIPHVRLLGPSETNYADLRGYVAPTLLVTALYFLLLCYATGIFSRLKEERERKLLESRNRFRAKSMQLEKMATSMRKKVSENVYMKRAAMGYVEKKEFELEMAKKDLEEQIEKLRKTQKSMVFMIEDLNEMSAQLKSSRDNLEDKVRERTDELLRISRKLHRSERLAFLGKLAGSVTHELRNPLAVLKNAAYYLDKTYAGSGDDKMTKYVDIIKKEIGVIDAIIDDIMGFAKTRGPRLEEADIREVVENAVSLVNIPEMVDVRKDFEDLPRVEMDTNQVLHAIMNIANNAIMAMNGNGVLTFTIRRDNGFVRLDIGDTGPGIPPEQRALIFEPLYSSKPKGTGLGLPIAKMMIDNQDGRIEFRSEMGVGTVFSILLPVKRRKRGDTTDE